MHFQQKMVKTETVRLAVENKIWDDFTIDIFATLLFLSGLWFALGPS